jgi:hypothetical protein
MTGKLFMIQANELSQHVFDNPSARLYYERRNNILIR